MVYHKPLLRHATRLVHILEAEQRPPKSLTSMAELPASTVATPVSVTLSVSQPDAYDD